jgi:hypothetical protein
MYFRSALAAAACLLSFSASAQDNVMKTCGDKWQAAKAANATGGKTWPEFLSACRAETAAAAAKATPPAAAPAQPANQPAAPRKPPVFPDDVSARYSAETPSRARQKTCGDQFRANKATDSNGGLKWIEKGGGYWSRCNAYLKARKA